MAIAFSAPVDDAVPVVLCSVPGLPTLLRFRHRHRRKPWARFGLIPSALARNLSQPGYWRLAVPSTLLLFVPRYSLPPYCRAAARFCKSLNMLHRSATMLLKSAGPAIHSRDWANEVRHYLGFEPRPAHPGPRSHRSFSGMTCCGTGRDDSAESFWPSKRVHVLYLDPRIGVAACAAAGQKRARQPRAAAGSMSRMRKEVTGVGVARENESAGRRNARLRLLAGWQQQQVDQTSPAKGVIGTCVHDALSDRRRGSCCYV